MRSSPSRACGVVFCGGGPAATGVIVCAAQDGRLDELLDRGVYMIEQGESLCTGSVGHYGISGNTPASSFVGWLRDPQPVFAPIAADPATQELLRLGSRYPSLHLVRPYLERLGITVREFLESHPKCTVALRTSVRSVQLLEGGGVRVVAEHMGDPANPFSVIAAHAVIAMGGDEPPGMRTLNLLPGLTLADYDSKLCHVSDVIDDRLDPPAHLVEAVRETGSVVVVGGSHSAWSAALVLLRDPAFRRPGGGPPAITILHRSPLLFFFDSAEQARAAGYPFDEVLDVCPKSGYVHRWAGLRAPEARALALQVVGSGEAKPPVRTLQLVDEPAVRADVRRVLDAAGLVVGCVGYVARLPAMTWADGRPLEPAVSETGLVVTRDAQLVTAEGAAVPELLVYGLGAGLGADSGIAGEPSYRGRFDAVRLYQNEVGRIALGSLLADTPELSGAAV